MRDEQPPLSSQYDNTTPSTRISRLGGPMTAARRKEAKQRFLSSLGKDPNISAAADAAGIHRDTAYRWREQDKTFAQGWDQAIERLNNVARSAIYQRGIIGWDEPVISMGQVVYEMEPVLDNEGKQLYERGKPKMRRGKPVTLHKWSDPLALAYAKANLPEYKDKPQVNVHAQIADLAEQAKRDLLADLEAALANEDKDQAY